MAAYYADPSAMMAQTSSSHTHPLPSDLGTHSLNGPSLYDIPTDSENEAEVDELDSDSEVDVDMDANTSNAGPKKGARRSGERTPGTTLLPSTRLDNILQGDGVTGNLTMSKEASFVLSTATEEFIKRMAQAGQRQAAAARRNTVVYKDMASSIQQYQEFMFLEDIIPQPISLSEALARRAQKEKERFEEDPALASVPQDLPPPSVSVSNAAQAKGKGKGKAANGKEKDTEKTSSTSKNKKDTVKRDGKGKANAVDSKNENASAGVTKSVSRRASRNTRASRDWMDVDTEPAPEDVAMNGISHPPPPDPIIKTDTSSIPRQNSTPHDPESRNTIQQSHNHDPTSFDQNSSWPGQYTGPASGFLQENPKIVSYAQSDTPRIASLPMNPGRTIYSQQLPNRSENGLNR